MPKGLKGFQKGKNNPMFEKSPWNKGKDKRGFCLDCGKKLKGYGSKRCSNCSNKGINSHFWKGGRTLYKLTCNICNKEFFVDRKYRVNRAKYCSLNCSNIAIKNLFKSSEYREKISGIAKQKGFGKWMLGKTRELSPHWKGGISYNKRKWQLEYRHRLGINKRYREDIKAMPKKYHKQKRHSLERGGGILSLKIIQQVYEDNIKKFGTLTCYLCLKPITFKDDTLEHIIPLSRGGTNARNNLEIAHKKCNCSKHTLTEEEYRRREDMSQNQAILEYLKSGHTLTGLDALRLFGTMKLASRISELKDEGNNIFDETIHDEKTGKHYKRYWLTDDPKNATTKAETPLVAPNAPFLVDIAQKAPNALNLPQNAKNGHLEHEEVIKHANVGEERIKLQMFEKNKQFSFMGG